MSNSSSEVGTTTDAVRAPESRSLEVRMLASGKSVRRAFASSIAVWRGLAVSSTVVLPLLVRKQRLIWVSGSTLRQDARTFCVTRSERVDALSAIRCGSRQSE